MSRPLKPGDAVLVIGGPRKGELTTVLRAPYPLEPGTRCVVIKAGELVVDTDLPDINDLLVVQRPSWLLPLHDPDKTAEYLAELNVPAESEVGK